MIMLPRLEAEETMRAATATALGSGTFKVAEARRATAALERAARPGTGQHAPAPPDERLLAAMGLGLEER